MKSLVLIIYHNVNHFIIWSSIYFWAGNVIFESLHIIFLCKLYKCFVLKYQGILKSVVSRSGKIQKRWQFVKLN